MPLIDTEQSAEHPGLPDAGVEALIVRMAQENSGWGYDRIVGALANLGHQISDQTVGNILKRHGIAPTHKRSQKTTCGKSSSRRIWLFWRERIAGTLATAIFDLPVVTIGSRFGGIPTGFRRMAIPEFRVDLILPLLPSAFTVALLAANTRPDFVPPRIAHSQTARRLR